MSTKQSKTINDILNDVNGDTKVEPTVIADLESKITTRLDNLTLATKSLVNNNDVEGLRVIHNELYSKEKNAKPKRSITNMTDKVKYVIWAAGFVIGLIIGMIVGGITAALISDFDPLMGVVGWIQFLIVIVFGIIGWSIASSYTDRRR